MEDPGSQYFPFLCDTPVHGGKLRLVFSRNIERLQKTIIVLSIKSVKSFHS